ncbi:MAG: hypothetical protein HUJ26_01070 [Planctomycetaceae bacterium]|nr:hypothetical protein [Planctomycetaceae bacterium]
MSTIYRLRFDSRNIPENKLESILREWGEPKTIEGRLEIAKTGIRCSISSESVLGKELIEETYGVFVDTSLSCIADKSDNHTQGIKNLVELVVLILNRTCCDFIFMADDRTRLMRVAENILVDSRDDSWWEIRFHDLLVRHGLRYEVEEMTDI